MDGTNHIVEPHEVRPPDHAEDESTPECTDESFDGLFRRELDQRGTAKGDAPDVGKYIIANDQRNRDKEPDQSLKDIVDDEVAAKRFRPGCCSEQRSYLDTTIKSKLIWTQQKRPNCCLR